MMCQKCSHYKLPSMKSTDGEGLKSPSCIPPNHQRTCTGSGGPTASHVRLKEAPGNIAISWGSNVKWGTPEEQSEKAKTIQIEIKSKHEQMNPFQGIRHSKQYIKLKKEKKKT